MNEERRILLMKRKYWGGLMLIILFIAVISAYVNLWEEQIGNNVTLMVEIGVGIGIAIVVSGISRQNESYIEKKVKEMSDTIQIWKTSDEKREKEVKKFLLKAFLTIDSGLDNITEYTVLLEQSANDLQRGKYHNKIKRQRKKNYELAKDCLNNSLIFSDVFFNLTQIRDLKSFFTLCTNRSYSSRSNEELKLDSRLIKQQSKPWIEKLSEELENEIPLVDLKEETTRKKLKNDVLLTDHSEKTIIDQTVKKTTMPISVSVDRTVYPLDSTVHVNFYVQTIQSIEKILYKVLDSNENLLLLQEIDPANDECAEMQEHGIYQTSFTMKGDSWNVRERYTVQAIYGTRSACTSFLIERRSPVIQSDKSVYMMGSDMIVTVIDPDADKDSDIVEHVGDKEDSKLVIKCPYGEIDGYKLRETGESTGIFQGIIRIAGMRKEGFIVPQNIDGQMIDKIQGTGILDGCIGGTPGNELTATYTSKSGTAQISFYIVNFGAVVELDQKEYSPTDKVHITIVAPDFNFDPEKIDEIGENPESIVIARTSCDEIKKCRLVETGPDTGIFTGAVQLERKIGINSQLKNSESTDIKLFCRDDDFIEISFIAFNNEKFVAKAAIRSHRIT